MKRRAAASVIGASLTVPQLSQSDDPTKLLNCAELKGSSSKSFVHILQVSNICGNIPHINLRPLLRISSIYWH